MKTLKQIADEIGVDKQKVYRFVKKNHITEALESASGKQYDEAAEELIKSHFSQNEAHHEEHQSNINDAVFEALLMQLEAKDKQITELQKLLDQEQQLHMATKTQLLALEDKTSRHWWQRKKEK